MTSYLLHPTVEVRRQSDGTFAALGKDLPIFVAAPTEDELWRRIANLQPSVARLLEVSGEGDVEAFLRSRGVAFEVLEETDEQTRAVEVPLLVRVAAS